MSTPFGRVDDQNNVYVIENGVERKVGQYAIGDQTAALAFYETRFADLEAQVKILEQRIIKAVDAKNLVATYEHLTKELEAPNVVGDIAALRARVAKLSDKISALAAAKAEENKEAIEAALKAREELVQKAEALAAADPAKTIWKAATAELAALFESWQTAQKTGPRVPKAEADALWKRFSTARTKVEAAKRAFFAASDAKAKEAKATKTSLAEKAEALVAKGGEAVADYRKLLDQWKTAGRTGSKADDVLWARFKAAGDAIYAAKGEQIAVVSASQAEAFAAKVELLKELAGIDPAKDLAGAKKLLAGIQDRWEKSGRVSRDQMAQTEDKLKAIEAAVRKAEAEHWKANDPAAKARKDDATIKLEEAIAKLEAQIKATSDKKKLAELEESLKARKAWLAAIASA